MSMIATSAPARASRTAHARPIPRAAPVTAATLPVRSSLIGMPSSDASSRLASRASDGLWSFPQRMMRAVAGGG